MANKLTSYQSPNESFYAKQDEFNDNEYLIEDGEELIYDEINEIDDDELLEWAAGDELLSEEEGHLLDDGKVNYDSLREAWISYKKREQEENPSSYFYPSGRAFIWFDGQNFNFPKDIKIEYLDGLHPGDDSQHVYVYSYESLVKLQTFLYEKGLKVNFIFRHTR